MKKKQIYDDIVVFFDVDGVLADYEFEEILLPNYNYSNKPKLKPCINFMEKILTELKLDVHILSICSSEKGKLEKLEWLNKNIPNLNKYKIDVIVNSDAEREEILKVNVIEKYTCTLKDKYIIVIDDTHDILRYLKIIYGEKIYCIHVSSLINSD